MTAIPEELVSRALFQFFGLRKALIDASSIIYMDKAGFLAKVATAMELHSPEEILVETGLEGLPIKPVRDSDKRTSNDQKLIACALLQQLPVISEDRKILLRLDSEQAPYFNALMMLNHLLFRGDISSHQHGAFFHRLMGCSRYNSRVLAFSKAVYAAIVNRNGEGIARCLTSTDSVASRRTGLAHADGFGKD